MSRFKALIADLDRVFKHGCTEAECRAIVARLREYDGDRDPADVERVALAEQGWPECYHPCDHMERIRHCIVFRQ